MNLVTATEYSLLNETLLANRVGEASLLVFVNTDEKTKIVALSALEKSEIILDCYQRILSTNYAWLIDCVVSYESLLIEYDIHQVDHYYVVKLLKNMLSAKNKHASTVASKEHDTYVIPVCYELEHTLYPNDRALVAKYTGLTINEIVNLHTFQEFRIYAVGFMPNFAYLGELNASLNVPRLSQPRLKVPCGAVAIADNQTAVYPSISPGGWHIIGYTPVKLLGNIDFEFKVGQHVKFDAISENKFHQFKQVAHGRP